MKTLLLILVAVCLLALSGCAQTQKTAPADEPATAQPPTPTPTPGDPVRNVMWTKLEHSQQILEGLSFGDYDAIERSAKKLEWLSRESSFLVSDSVTYVLYSDQFRETVADLADHAEQQNLHRATLDFMQAVQTCVTCHTYIRQERLRGDFPERVTSVDDSWLDDLVALSSSTTPATAP